MKIIEKIKYEINKYATKVIKEGSKEMSDVYIGKLSAVRDMEKILDKLEKQ